jgi:cathepsin L
MNSASAYVLYFLASAAWLSIATAVTVATLPHGGQVKMHGDAVPEAMALDEEEVELADASFEKFVSKHKRDYQHGTDEYEMRKALFHQRLEAVRSQNRKTGRRWQAAPSKFSDRTDAERALMRGYRKAGSLLQRAGAMIESNGSVATLYQQKDLPEEKNWQHLQVANDIKDQGSCGSCWAIATVSVLDAHYEIWSAKSLNKGQPRKFSAQQVLDCTPNPEECGGQGGCQGATVELGMKWILQNGISTEDDDPYTAQDGSCSVQGQSGEDGDALKKVLTGHQPSGDAAPAHSGGAGIGMASYLTLESNVDSPLAEALSNYGPVAVSASAGSWYEYQSGVFDGCDKDAVVDHAITAYGYGKDQDQKYWLIKNSWGSDWGDKGFIRILRHDANDKYCGTDNDPSQGVACKGGPSSVTVCGMCGILYDSVVPHFSGSPGSPVSKQSTPVESSSVLMRMEKVNRK